MSENMTQTQTTEKGRHPLTTCQNVGQFISKSNTEKSALWNAYYGVSIFNDNQNPKFWVSEIIRKGEQ
jgi:hypothetical protein